MIFKECEDKDGYKGGGSIQESSRLMVKFVMESFEANILSEDMMKMSSKSNGSI